MRTSVTTGSPAATNSPGGGVALADRAVEGRDEHRVGELLAREVELRAALGEHALAVARLVARLLVAPLGDLVGGLGGVEVGLRQQPLLVQLLGAGARGRRLGEHRLRLLDDGRRLEIRRAALVGPQAETRPGLVERRGRLADAELEVGRSQPRQHLAALHDAAEVDRQGDEPAGDLGAQHHLVLRRQRAGDGHHVGQRRALRGRHRDDARRLAGLALLSARLGLAAAAAEQRRDGDDGNGQAAQARHEHDSQV